MSGEEWDDDGRDARMWIDGPAELGVDWVLSASDDRADVIVSSQDGDEFGIIALKASDRDAAKSVALGALQRVSVSLSAHFAPVLRWTHGEHESTATLGRWRLSATDGAWSVGVVAFEWVGPVDGSRGPTTRENNRRAAETSLRSLGVTFRTEDGP